MNPIVTTILTSFLSTLVIPWLTKHIPGLDPASTSSWIVNTVNGLLVGGTTGAAHAIHQNVTPSPDTIKSVAKVLVMALFVPLLMTLGACSSLTGFLNTPSNALTITGSAVEVGVSGVLDAVPSAQRFSVAADLVNAAKALEAVDTNDTVSLSQFQVLAAQKLAKASLNPTQQNAINAAINAAVQAIAGKIQSGLISTSQSAAINTVLNWIIVGATPYLPAT